MNHRLLLASSILAILGFALFLGVQPRPAGPPFPQRAWVEAKVTAITDGDTIKVRFQHELAELPIRLAAVNAPEIENHPTCQTIGVKAEKLLQRLIPVDSRVKIGLAATGYQAMPYEIGRDERLLGLVSSDDGRLIQTELIRAGLGRLYMSAKASPNSDKFAFAKLFSSQIKSLLNAQTEAAKQKRGWWSTCDPFRKANLVIAAIDFWDYPQVVYIVNRGKLPINWTKFSLSDNTRSHRLDFNKLNAKCPMLAAGQVLEVDTYDEQGENKVNCGTDGTGRIVINWYKPIGTGNHVWNEGDEGDTACLFLTDAPDAGCNESATQPAENNGLCYVYRYPPKDVTQTSSATIDPRCPRLAKAGDGNH